MTQRPSEDPHPVRRRVRLFALLVVVAMVAAGVVLTVQGAAPWSDPADTSDTSGTSADGDLDLVPPGSPTPGGTSATPSTATATPSATTPTTTAPADYRVQPGQVYALKPAIARARDLLPMATDLRISSFNVLGHSHTRPGGDRTGWASSTTRMGWAWQLLDGAGIDVIGFQELQSIQVSAFLGVSGGAFAVYPGLSQGPRDAENSIAWRTSEWQAVETHTIAIPYFGGNLRQMPYVLLRDVLTGQLVWFVNVHNPADKFGAAQGFRNAATARESALVNQLGADGTPVFLTGDMNDRETAYCSLTSTTTLQAADGGSSVGGCLPPVQPAVDWIFGSAPVRFTTYTRVQSGLIRQTTDHPFVWAEAHIEPTSVLPGTVP